LTVKVGKEYNGKEMVTMYYTVIVGLGYQAFNLLHPFSASTGTLLEEQFIVDYSLTMMLSDQKANMKV